MRRVIRLFLTTILIPIAVSPLSAQDTFSIVAVDPETGEVGSAGASCVGSFDVATISTVLPGIGAINTQAQYHPVNQIQARAWLQQGLPPQAILDSLTANDITAWPGSRQYGVAVLAEGGMAAAFTGADCMDHKSHRVGQTYAIQGNILLGPQILDSMEARFLRSAGLPLADRLMAALQGANVPGADSRCLAGGTSSNAAYIQVAKPGDGDSLYLDLRNKGLMTVEPLDSLQRMYDAWKLAAAGVDAAGSVNVPTLDITANPSSVPVIHADFPVAASVADITLFDTRGVAVARLLTGRQEAGSREFSLRSLTLASGIYYCRLSADRHVITRKVVIAGSE
jgi:uncharacterized Ntn-hydrolase superfamily protein